MDAWIPWILISEVEIQAFGLQIKNVHFSMQFNSIQFYLNSHEYSVF